MIRIIRYQIVNGTRSEPFTLEKMLNNEEELKKLKKELEEKNHCYEEQRTIMGVERKKVKEIMLTYQIR